MHDRDESACTVHGSTGSCADVARADGSTARPAGDARSTPGRIALLCPRSRLRRLLHVSLQTDGYEIVEWDVESRPNDAHAAVVVADLDSLALDVPQLLALLRAWDVPDLAALLVISVYPLDLHELDRRGPYDALQPPFSPDELASHVRHVLQRTGQCEGA